MTQSRRFLPLAIAALLIAAIGWQLYATREPSYQGKTLTKWLDEGYGVRPPPSADIGNPEEALHAIGKAAIPSLMRMLKAKDSRLKYRFFEWLESHSIMSLSPWPALLRRMQASKALMVLGPEARNAFPEMVQLFQDPVLAYDVAPAMAKISPAAIPVLRSGLSNQEQRVRTAAIWGLRHGGTNAWVAMPEVVSALGDRSPMVRKAAVFALASFGQEPATVLPALWKSAQEDLDSDVRVSAISAIGCFGQRAAAFAPRLQELLASTNLPDNLLVAQMTNALQKIKPSALDKTATPPADSATHAPP